MLYAIVAYDESGEADYVPLKWLTTEFAAKDVRELVENKTSVQFYWPSIRALDGVARARRRRIDPEVGWLLNTARILSTAGQFCTIADISWT